MTRLTLTIVAPLFVAALSFVGCNGDDDDGTDTMNDGGTADDGGMDAPGDDGVDDAPGDDGMDDAPGDDGMDDGGGGVLGDDCTQASECEENYCLMFTNDAGQEFGFCSRQCTSADDCPESGWECNLAPYTACVPA